MGSRSHDDDTLFAGVLSWTILIVAVPVAGMLGWYIPAIRSADVELFKTFKVDLPELTQLLLSIPDLCFGAVAAVAILAMVAVQLLARRSQAAVFHLFVLVLGCIFYQAFTETMSLPERALQQTIMGPHKK